MAWLLRQCLSEQNEFQSGRNLWIFKEIKHNTEKSAFEIYI